MSQNVDIGPSFVLMTRFPPSEYFLYMYVTFYVWEISIQGDILVKK